MELIIRTGRVTRKAVLISEKTETSWNLLKVEVLKAILYDMTIKNLIEEKMEGKLGWSRISKLKNGKRFKEVNEKVFHKTE